MSVLLETSVGDIVIDLYTERAPQTTLNFLKLCKIKYYNFCSFFNVQKDFMVQTGDPNETGKGGESIFGIVEGPHKKYFPAEIYPKLKHKNTGTVSMSVAQGQDTTVNGVGSQFFITTGKNLDYLDGKHAVFGEVAEGLDVLEKINSALCDEKGRPFRDIRIKHTIILDDPFPDPSGIEGYIPDASPLPTREQLQSIMLAEDESLELDEDPETLNKQRREKEARAQALTLEMVGDLPFAEVRPPENVLFVCKLNPVTRDEDIELIFSRFGTIISCEIIRDKKTGDSLCYAFIEFDKKEQCEEAFFKMDNCLIDDRRIHVDFSQSVSKLHRDWVARRMGGSGDFGGEGLQRRTKYREGGSTQRGDEYDLVFDHGGDFETERKQHGGLGKSDERLPKDRKRSRSSSKERGPPRRRDDKYRDRDRERDRDRDKQRERDREYPYRKNERRRERSWSRERNRKDRSRSRDQNRRPRR